MSSDYLEYWIGDFEYPDRFTATVKRSTYFNEGKFADDACGLLNDLKITTIGDGGFGMNEIENYFANWGQKLTATQGMVDNGFDLSFYVTYYGSKKSPYNPDQIAVWYRPLQGKSLLLPTHHHRRDKYLPP